MSDEMNAPNSSVEPVRLGLVGVGRGGASSNHARSFSTIYNGPPVAGAGHDWPRPDVRVRDARITAVWDSDLNLARAHAEAFGIENVCDSPESLTNVVDGVMLVDDVTMKHQKHALTFVKMGVPTFVDKPLTADLSEAERILSAAKACGAPFMSSSALRYSTELEAQSAELDAAGDPVLTVAATAGKSLGDLNIVHYGIHPLELVFAAFGPGIQSVQNIGDAGHIVKLNHATKGTVLLIVDPDISHGFRLTVMGTAGDASIRVSDSAGFYADMLRTWASAVRNNESPIALDETYELIATLIAARNSKKQNGAVVPVTSSLLERIERSAD